MFLDLTSHYIESYKEISANDCFFTNLVIAKDTSLYLYNVYIAVDTNLFIYGDGEVLNFIRGSYYADKKDLHHQCKPPLDRTLIFNYSDTLDTLLAANKTFGDNTNMKEFMSKVIEEYVFRNDN